MVSSRQPPTATRATAPDEHRAGRAALTQSNLPEAVRVLAGEAALVDRFFPDLLTQLFDEDDE